jgi:peptidoglycan-associated lipoprotein
MTIAAVLTCSIVAIGCGSDPKEPPATPAGGNEDLNARPASRTQAQDDEDPSQSNINISDEIKRACGITDAEAFFAYDSANTRPEDKAVFGKLAKCFSDGPLKGRLMQLVGHADPRGEDEYNMLLGERRAANVKTAISNEGLSSEKIATTSRGEMDASGTEESSWAKDRRVDVLLGD